MHLGDHLEKNNLFVFLFVVQGFCLWCVFPQDNLNFESELNIDFSLLKNNYNNKNTTPVFNVLSCCLSYSFFYKAVYTHCIGRRCKPQLLYGFCFVLYELPFFFFCTKMINQETTYFRVLQGMSDNLAEFKRSLIHPNGIHENSLGILLMTTIQ